MSIQEFEAELEGLTEQSEYLEKIADFAEYCSQLGMESSHVSDVAAPEVRDALLFKMGELYFRRGNFSHALDCLLASLLLWEHSDKRHSPEYAERLLFIGKIGLEFPRFIKTPDMLKRALSLFRKFSMPVQEADTLIALSIFFQYNSEAEKARKYFFQALALLDNIHTNSDLPAVFRTLAHALNDADFSIAESFIPKILEEFSQKNDLPAQSAALLLQGKILIKSEKFESALDALHRARFLSETLGEQRHLAESYRLISIAHERLGHCAEALDSYKIYHRLEQEVFSAEADRRTKSLFLQYDIEQYQKEIDKQTAVTFEVAEASVNMLEALEKIQELNAELQKKNLVLETLNHEKSELMGIVAHDLKNPLASILVSVGMMQRFYQKYGEQELREKMKSIENTAEYMRSIVLNLLNLDEMERGIFRLKTKKVDVYEQARELFGIFSERAVIKNITMYFEPHGENFTCFADETALREILENLLSNAMKYSFLGKNICLKIEKLG